MKSSLKSTGKGFTEAADIEAPVTDGNSSKNSVDDAAESISSKSSDAIHGDISSKSSDDTHDDISSKIFDATHANIDWTYWFPGHDDERIMVEMVTSFHHTGQIHENVVIVVSELSVQLSTFACLSFIWFFFIRFIISFNMARINFNF